MVSLRQEDTDKTKGSQADRLAVQRLSSANVFSIASEAALSTLPAASMCRYRSLHETGAAAPQALLPRKPSRFPRPLAPVTRSTEKPLSSAFRFRSKAFSASAAAVWVALLPQCTKSCLRRCPGARVATASSLEAPTGLSGSSAWETSLRCRLVTTCGSRHGTIQRWAAGADFFLYTVITVGWLALFTR